MKKSQKVIKVNTKVTFKGCCGLCLAFDCKAHVTNHQRWPISYLNTSVWKIIGVNSEFHIPIPILWNWFLECPNSNSSSGIVASTPIPTQWNWGDSTGIPISKFPTLCSPLKRRKRQLETPSSLLFF